MFGNKSVGMVTIGFFLAAGLFLVSPLSAGPVAVSSAGPTITVTSGDVQVMGYGKAGWFAAQVGLVLKPGDLLRTGSGSRAEIQHYSGTTRLYENTILAIPSIYSRGGVKDLRKVDLERGSGIFHLDHEKLKGGFEVRTRQVIAGVKGTTFAILANELESSVAVLEGRVSVTFRGESEDRSTTLLVGKGKSVDVRKDQGIGEVRRFREMAAWQEWEQGTSLGLNPAGKKNQGLHQGQNGVGPGYNGEDGDHGKSGQDRGKGLGLGNSVPAPL